MYNCYKNVVCSSNIFGGTSMWKEVRTIRKVVFLEFPQVTSILFTCVWTSVHGNRVASITDFFFEYWWSPTRIDIGIKARASSFSSFPPPSSLLSSLLHLHSRSIKKSVAKMSSRVQSRVHEGRRFQDTAAHRRDAIWRDATRYSATRCVRRDTFPVAPPSAIDLQELALRAPVINNSLPGKLSMRVSHRFNSIKRDIIERVVTCCLISTYRPRLSRSTRVVLHEKMISFWHTTHT